jgi:hypothetical protein
MVPMNERPDAFSGVASIDRGENDAPTSPQCVLRRSGCVCLVVVVTGRTSARCWTA